MFVRRSQHIMQVWCPPKYKCDKVHYRLPLLTPIRNSNAPLSLKHIELRRSYYQYVYILYYISYYQDCEFRAFASLFFCYIE